jgi:hypothetical protein
MRPATEAKAGLGALVQCGEKATHRGNLRRCTQPQLPNQIPCMPLASQRYRPRHGERAGVPPSRSQAVRMVRCELRLRCFRVRDSADVGALVGSPVQVSRSCCPSSRSRLLHGSVICGTACNFSEEHSFGRFLLRGWASWLRRKSLLVRPPKPGYAASSSDRTTRRSPNSFGQSARSACFSQGCGKAEPGTARI